MLKTSVHFTISKQREDLAVLLFYRCDVVVAERVSPRQCYVLFSDDTAAFWQPERAAIVELLLFCSLHNDFSRLVFFFFLVGIRSTGVSNVHSLTKLHVWRFTVRCTFNY